MIVTVTMNTAIDKTVELMKLERGSLNRLHNVVIDPGGKGINVSKTTKALGGETIACGFVGGSSGMIIEQALKKQGIQSDFVRIDKETRTNLKVIEENGLVTELNEPGPLVSGEEIKALKDKLLSYAKEDTWFVIAGSIPRGVDKGIYRDIIQMVKEKGSKVFLDADGELFKLGLEAGPDMIKPNKGELLAYFQKDYIVDENQLVEMGSRFLDKGVKMVAISLGQQGAFFINKEKVIQCVGLKVKAHSTVGAGDAMVAAITYGLDKGMDLESCIKLGMAVSAGAVTTQGTKPPDMVSVEELKKQVEVIYL
ncbi:MAG: 1-phosphofructokinase [Anaerocolumna sp.]